MRQGYGSVNIVNVNGHTEGAKVAAFARALDERGNADSRLAVFGSHAPSPRASEGAPAPAKESK